MEAKNQTRQQRKRQLLQEFAELHLEEMVEAGDFDQMPHFGTIERAASSLGSQLRREIQARTSREVAADCTPQTACPACGASCKVTTKRRATGPSPATSRPWPKLCQVSRVDPIFPAAAVVYNRPATTFNAAGVNPAFVAHYGADLSNAELLIDAYRVQGEVLSSLQDSSFARMLLEGPAGLAIGALGAIAPNSVGKALWLEGDSFSSLARHSMSEVLAGMQKMM